MNNALNYYLHTLGMAVLAAGVCFSAVDAGAHGVKSKGAHVHSPPSRAGFWSFLVNPAAAAARFSISVEDGLRRIKSDGLPDHEPGQFPNRGNPHTISSQNYFYEIPLTPQKATQTTYVGHRNFGIALNGVPFDPLTAEYWNRDRSSGWNIEAKSGAIDIGLDRHNAHVQPNGAYHYHGLPTGVLEQLPYKDRPALIGYAADGFPIYGPYGVKDPNDPASTMVELRSSHRVKSGTRPSGPGGAYDGTYVQDYEFVRNLGDLDACNGREGVTAEFPQGTYYYVLTATYPFIPRCFVGTPHPSFVMRGGGGFGRILDDKRRSGPPPRRTGGRPRGSGHPDLHEAARKLGISHDQLRRALGPPPPDFGRAARELGVSPDTLRRALHGR